MTIIDDKKLTHPISSLSVKLSNDTRHNFNTIKKTLLKYHFRSIFLTTDLSNSRNLIRYNLADGTEETLHDSISGIGTYLTVDTKNKWVYWILFTSENNYKIFKTTYTGQTSQIGADQTGSVGDVDIAQGDGYFYILDSASSEIKKYNKTTETMVSAISISPGAERIIVVTGRY
jgi:chloramphenicol O-acetyltransferase